MHFKTNKMKMNILYVKYLLLNFYIWSNCFPQNKENGNNLFIVKLHKTLFNFDLFTLDVKLKMKIVNFLSNLRMKLKLKIKN